MPIRIRSVSLAVALLGSGGVTLAAYGHHSVLPYDNERGIEIAGRVVDVAFANPHTILVIRHEREDGSDQRWTVESESAVTLARLGWDDGMIKIGDRVTVVGAPAKDGSAAMRCQRLELEGGRILSCFPMK